MGSSPDECPLNAANSGEIWGTGEGTITSWVRRDIGQQGSDNSSVSQWPPQINMEWSGWVVPVMDTSVTMLKSVPLSRVPSMPPIYPTKIAIFSNTQTTAIIAGSLHFTQHL